MGRTNASMFAFNRGEVSKAALARVDNERLRLAAECQLNWLPTVIGEMTLRPGLQMINEVFGDAAGQMVPFIFSKSDTAILELTPNIMRVEIAGQLVTRVAVSAVISSPTFAGAGTWTTTGSTAGAAVTFVGALTLVASAVGSIAQVEQTVAVIPADHGKEHALRVSVSNGPVTIGIGTSVGLSDVLPFTSIDTGAHSLAFTPTTDVVVQIYSTDNWQKVVSSVIIEPAGVMELPTPWGSDALPTLRTDQSGDIVYCAAYGVQQQKIERRSAHSWSVARYCSGNGPFSTVDTSGTLIVCPADPNGNIIALRPLFAPGCEGALIQAFTPGQTNNAALGGPSAFSAAVRVTGVGDTRNYAWSITGTWGGTVSLQRSFDGPTEGFSTVSTATANGTIASTTGGVTSTPDLDNVIAWERVGFEAANYASGVAHVSSSYAGGGSWGIARILAYISPTEVSVEVLQPFNSELATNDFAISDWSSQSGWPTSVAFFEGRLDWSGALNLWCSQPDSFTGYASQDAFGNDLGDAAVIIETFGSGPVDSVNWLLPLTRLLAGRDTTIESVRASSFDEVLTPSNVSSKACATRGAARAKAIKLDTSGIFGDESGTRLYKLSFSPQKMDYAPQDLTRLNADILEPGWVDIAVQRQRDTHIWLPKNDGQAAVLLEDEDDDISCWWRLQTLGVIENVCVLPAPSGPENQVFVTVRRSINGVTRRFREKLAPRLNCLGGTINQLFDCHLLYVADGINILPINQAAVPWLPNTLVGIWADGAYLGTATTSATGLVTLPDGQPHSNIVIGLLGEVAQATAQPADYASVSSVPVSAAYEGYPAEVFADGRRIGVLPVTNGALTLPGGRTAQSITAFVGYVAPFMSAKLAYAADGGTAINQTKAIDHVGLLLLNTSVQGLLMGQRFDTLDALPEIEQGVLVPAGTIWDQYDQDMQEVPGQWDTDARLCLLGQAPYPVTVNGVVIGVTTNG